MTSVTVESISSSRNPLKIRASLGLYGIVATKVTEVAIP